MYANMYKNKRKNVFLECVCMCICTRAGKYMKIGTNMYVNICTLHVYACKYVLEYAYAHTHVQVYTSV